MFRRYFPTIFVCIFGFSVVSADNPPPSFSVRMLALDANEGIAAGDIDGDGKMDLVAGRNWYRGGEWAPRPLRNIEDWNGYVESNGDYLFDVNQDGRLDVIAGSFLPTEIHWYENPGDEALRLGKMWPKHLLVDTGNTCNEGQLMEDIDGDGRPEWIVNSWQKDVPAVIWRLVEKSGAEKSDQPGNPKFEMKPHQVGESGNGHGVAVGDISGDGKADLLMGQGWYEQPSDEPWGGPWKFHADWDLQASLPMIVTDLDQDGDGDIIIGKGHDYGLFWWRNEGTGEDGKIKWTESEIDNSFSQPHSLAWCDLDGDGNPELVTGKRYFAHNGNDPGGREMPCLYYYRWDAKTNQFARHTIEEGHVDCGLQIVTTDLNEDQKVDIAVAGKSGTYLLLAK
jgi:FG-GAP-like repeat/FG-GAP repeat